MGWVEVYVPGLLFLGTYRRGFAQHLVPEHAEHRLWVPGAYPIRVVVKRDHQYHVQEGRADH